MTTKTCATRAFARSALTPGKLEKTVLASIASNRSTFAHR